MNLLLIGAQGSGKGTQASVLVKRLGIQHLSSGDLFRSAIDQGTPTGLAVKDFIDRGELVPDALTIQLVVDQLKLPEFQPGVILDGFPRTRDQARALDKALAEMGRGIDRAIYLHVPREQLMDRLMGRYVCVAHQHVYNLKSNPPQVAGICDLDGSELVQRSDDKPEKIERRLQIFFEQTIQVVHYYRAQHKVIEIDGNQPIASVSTELLRGLGVAAEGAA